MEQEQANKITTISIKTSTQIRLKKFWLEQDEEQEAKSFDDLLNCMMDYIEMEVKGTKK